MKKIIAAAAGLMMVGVMASSASAVENKFGGYWRTRMYTNIDMDGTESGTFSRVDTRTRLYYTAIFNENFKFVNKFEMDAVWGEEGPNDYGDLGADGVAIEVKQSYADFTLGSTNVKMGVQAAAIGRGFLFDSEFAGAVVTFNAGTTSLPFMWIKVGENEDNSPVDIEETTIFAFTPVIKASDNLTVNPYLVYAKQEGTDTNVYWAGADVDLSMGNASGWGTFAYNFGEFADQDVSAFLVALGAETGPVHGQVFYATGDDNAADGDIESFVGTGGQSYYWAEILGYGTFDEAVAGPTGDFIQNVYAANVGFTVKPMEKLKFVADVWYASLVEDDASGETDLGIEFDFKATYAVMDNLNLDLVAAYLLAGDAVGEEDPIELGARLSLSF